MRLRPRRPAKPTLFHADLAVGVIGVGMVVMSLVNASSATAVAAAADGSDWGPQGTLAGSSPVTATWDNTGNVASSVVPRNATQTLLHTGGKNYDDIAQADRQQYASYFGSTNGLGGLKVSVSQTQDLVNQSVEVTIAGAKANIAPGTVNSASYFQIFQCWGARGADGQPDPAATSPDPSTCQFGSPATDASGLGSEAQRIVAGDPLVGSGDWAPYKNFFPTLVPPFEAINGKDSGTKPSNDNTFYNTATTNEYAQVRVPASGTTRRQFEMQTGAESSGLGCGQRADEASTPTCWLVVVPRIDGVNRALSGISPSVWGERMQFKLGFQDVASACPGGTAQSLIGGSEMLATAAASWIPGVCDAANVTLGFTKLSDQTVRDQYARGASDAIVTTDPIAGASTATVVPLALTAPVLAFNLSYKPACTESSDLDITKVTSDSGARTCGYDDLAQLKTDLAKAGQPVRDLRMNALLVAKLLTMSYSQSLIQNFALPEPGWARLMPSTLTADPAFLRLNPQLHILPAASDISSLVLESQRSDAATHVWQWLENDPAARSFLSGCPDADGETINPFFSTRTYDGCSADATTLETQAQQKIDATDTPPGYTPTLLSYPPDGTPYPLPQWQQTPPGADSTGATINPLTLVDWQPRVTDMSVGARDAALGIRPRNDAWCSFAETQDQSCLPKPGKYKSSPSNLQPYGLRQVFTITDAASAARYQLSTASLCDDGGTHCVGADTDSLKIAAADFQPSGTTGFQSPATTPDYAGGAYPLTMPVYGVVRSSLSNATRGAYASAFSYITGAGQTPGYQSGDLPPGYASLSTVLTSQAAAGIASLRTPLPASVTTSRPAVTATKPGKATPTSSASASVSASASASASPGSSDGPGGSSGSDPSSAPSGKTPSQAGSPSPGSAPSAADTVQTTPVSASTESFHNWLLPVGLGLAMVAGLAGPFLRRRNNVRLR